MRIQSINQLKNGVKCNKPEPGLVNWTIGKRPGDSNVAEHHGGD